jgi:hypothetical protein
MPEDAPAFTTDRDINESNIRSVCAGDPPKTCLNHYKRSIRQKVFPNPNFQVFIESSDLLLFWSRFAGELG